ncbi:PspA/IM30 family protein [Jeotgalibacillus terrae]|uniref:PspA/IM30 family protein n=1 Tax=Jeotgalibacillus terrae TaxID=587735 RepID=A0ABW5ZJX6_9BACL|nr:PspA/IM30 family protein [Jeotgalibacillus terrae]MBM7580945.1 phage shock protein A [Jeotgalibacillus terrae]
MSNLLTKITEVIRQDIQESKWKQTQSNPVIEIQRELKEVQASVKKAKQLTERQELLKKEFEKEYDHAKSMATKRKEHVQLAEEAGEEALAAAALREFNYYSGRAERLEKTCAEAESQLEALELQLEQLTFELKDLELKRLEYMAKENAVIGEKQSAKLKTPEKATDEDRRYEQIEQHLKQSAKKKEELSIDEQIEQLK